MSYAAGPQWEYYTAPVPQPSSHAPQHSGGHSNYQTPVSPLNSSAPLDTALNKLSLSDTKTTYQNTPVTNQQPAQYQYSTHNGFPPATSSQQPTGAPPAQVPQPAQQPSYSSAPVQHQYLNQQTSSALLAQQMHPTLQAPTPQAPTPQAPTSYAQQAPTHARNHYPATSGAPTYATALTYPTTPNSYSQQASYQTNQNPPLRQPVGTSAPTYAAAAHSHPAQDAPQPYQAPQPQYSTLVQHNSQGDPKAYPGDVKHHYQASPVSNQAPAQAGQKGPQPSYVPDNQYNNYSPTPPPTYQQSAYGQPPSQMAQNAPYTPPYTPQSHTPNPQPAGYFPNNQKQANSSFTPPTQASYNGLPTPPYQGNAQGHPQGQSNGHQQGHPQAHTNGHPQGYAQGNRPQNVAYAQNAPGRASGYPGGHAPMGHTPDQVVGHAMQRPVQVPQQHAGAPHAAAPNGAKPGGKAGGLSSYTNKATSSAKKFWSGTSTGKKFAMGAGVLVAGVLGFEAAEAIGDFGDSGGGDYSSGGGDYSGSSGGDYSSGGGDYTSSGADYSGGGTYDSGGNYAYDTQGSDSLAQDQMMTSMNDSMNQQMVAGGQSVAAASGVTYGDTYTTDNTDALAAADADSYAAAQESLAVGYGMLDEDAAIF